ncbi:MAG: hypothetical protein PHH67_01330 [Methanosarcina sp.]|jgi:hypothetical protein|nr:hypothetical protein [Methanosarcina sp.]MDD3316082.1 hypothetical protein [Methanosarcina sp.]MDD4305148.1 hypothetical protein [Methanosarcina sp.]MDD4620970.1 hypothetical protein [Methanosarcina sp.]NLN44199.1 hypothetical protein [Methanosarcina sp.]
MKTRIALLSANPEKRMEALYNQSYKLGSFSSNLASFGVPNLYLPLTESNRIGLACGDVAEYKLKISVGPGEYDYVILTNYVKEKSAWSTDLSKNLIILPGQALTESFYSDMAIYYARQGYSTYILDRRETNVPANETDFSYMENWTIDSYLSDTYNGIAVSRIHTAFLSNESVEDIEVTVIGHSHGALILTAYEASEYRNLALGSVDRIVPVDIIIRYEPKYSELIQAQAQEFDTISSCIENRMYNSSDMAAMMQIASMALTNPDGKSSFQPDLTNRQFFRLMATQTHAFNEYPYTPNYHYWSGDLGGLYYVDENKLLNLTLTGGAVPYVPKHLDLYMAGLMGNVDGYEIEYSRISSPVLYVGLGGGFSGYGAWWYENEVGKINDKVTSINWNNQGHGSIALDYNSPELWALIHNWIEDN